MLYFVTDTHIYISKLFIRIKCLCNNCIYPFLPHFYIVELECAGLYIFFRIFVNHRL